MELTNKERNFLRKLAFNLDPVVRIGKEGLSETVLESIRQAIDKQELIKVKILNNSSEIASYELEEKICNSVKCVAVYRIGHTMIFFKKQVKNKKFGKITEQFLNFRKANKI